MSEWGREYLQRLDDEDEEAAALEARRKREVAAIAEKQRYDIRVEDKMAMSNLAKSTESLISMLSNRGDHHEVGTDLILTAMRVVYRLGVDAGRNLPLR